MLSFLSTFPPTYAKKPERSVWVPWLALLEAATLYPLASLCCESGGGLSVGISLVKGPCIFFFLAWKLGGVAIELQLCIESAGSDCLKYDSSLKTERKLGGGRGGVSGEGSEYRGWGRRQLLTRILAGALWVNNF